MGIPAVRPERHGASRFQSLVLCLPVQGHKPLPSKREQKQVDEWDVPGAIPG
jgi:hypothetical protein